MRNPTMLRQSGNQSGSAEEELRAVESFTTRSQGSSAHESWRDRDHGYSAAALAVETMGLGRISGAQIRDWC